MTETFAATAELVPGVLVRPATPDDHAALKKVCLGTAASGDDATTREDNPELVGLIYAVPYQVFEPDLAFVIEENGTVSGYVLGARDTAAFEARLQADWYPDLREWMRDPGPDESTWQGSDWARHMIHNPPVMALEGLAPYPAHGHIDLLPRLRGRGVGRAAMEHLITALRLKKAPGMHLDVAPDNDNAIGFYRKLGFEVIDHPSIAPGRLFMGKRLD
jgi:ribosomal protein S18 acetylase RimI-like enzyme